MAVVGDPPAGMPPSTRRPSSATWADYYGSAGTGQPTATSGGTIGAARVAAAHEQAESEEGAPITFNGLSPATLDKPAGVLVLAVVALAILSYLDA